jgi:cell wall-associated NlpC family hydrolase
VGGPAQEAVVQAAKTQLGLPYVWGGGNENGPSGGGFDCSGLVLYAFKQGGAPLPGAPRTAQTQYAVTAAKALPGGFDPASYQAGDLLFYGTADNIHHVAIAIGNGQLIQASTFGEPLNIKPIYHSDFFAATRPLGTPGAPQ